MRLRLGTLLVGIAFGFSLSRIGFSSWDEVHAMFTFQDPRLVLAFATAIVALAVSWAVIRRLSSPEWPRRPIHRGTLAGGALFGVGWALTGACPSNALVQIGEGQLAAVWTVLGILAGNWLYPVIHARFFRWSPGVCVDR